LQQGELSMVCVGLSERDLKNFGGATGGPGKILGGQWPPLAPPSSAPGLFGLILAALLLPAKLITYFFIQNCFKCDYNHYSTVSFGNTRLTLLPKNVLRL